MSDILAQIIIDQRAALAQQKQVIPLKEVQKRAEAAPLPRDFFAAVTQPVGALRVIAEVKKASPSAGVIRPDFDPVAIARSYHAHGAAAISCLTERKYFQGDLAYVQQIKNVVPLPVLRKDFLVDPYQVYEARAAGADAILLIAECLAEPLLGELIALAGELKMTTLLEVHDRENLQRVAGYFASSPPPSPLSLSHHVRRPILLGINNRNLRTMTTSLDHTLQLLEIVPDARVLVSESGIRTPQDVRRLRSADRGGVHRILVGEHLMRQPDPGDALAKLMA